MDSPMIKEEEMHAERKEIFKSILIVSVPKLIYVIILLVIFKYNRDYNDENSIEFKVFLWIINLLHYYYLIVSVIFTVFIILSVWFIINTSQEKLYIYLTEFYKKIRFTQLIISCLVTPLFTSSFIIIWLKYSNKLNFLFFLFCLIWIIFNVVLLITEKAFSNGEHGYGTQMNWLIRKKTSGEIESKSIYVSPNFF